MILRLRSFKLGRYRFFEPFTYFDELPGIFFNREEGGVDRARIRALGSTGT